MASDGRPANSIFVVRLEGEFDLADRHRLKDAFEVAQSAPVVVVDLAKATYIDSTVLACLVGLHRTTQKRKASLFLVGLRPTVLRLFEITALREIFDIRASLSDVPDVGIAEMRRLTIEGRPEHPVDRRNDHRVSTFGSVDNSTAPQC
ncbi:MAG: STAS domain-containing protein [Candidatus Cybelea sp.]